MWIEPLYGRPAERIRRILPRAKIVVGNTVASSVPEILLTKTEADVAVNGEGDVIIVELLRALESQEDLSRISGICYWQDDCYHAFQKDPYRRRSSPALQAEISDLIERDRLNYISMADELTFYKKEQALEFSQAILDSGLKFLWPSQCRAGLFDSETDLYIIERMKQAGCTNATFSLESASSEILKAMNKNITVEAFSFQAKLFQKAGMPVHTSLVFGYPQETPETIRKTFDICIENGIYPSSGYLLPQPGSGMYDYACEQGYIKDEEAYLLSLGDMQDLLLNLTQIPDEEFIDLIKQGAKRCRDALNLGLDEDRLIKTGHYRGNKAK